jgi:hypothetical protein
MKPSFGTDIISFMGVALGAAAGLALTAAIVTERSHADHHHDVHVDGDHAISVVVGHDENHHKVVVGDRFMRRKAIMGEEVHISELIEAELEAEQARLEGEKIRLRVGPRIEVVRGPEAVRIDRRNREERRR